MDWIEVDRVAYQLELDHGRNAYLYAQRLALDAKKAAPDDESERWMAVAAALSPRNIPNPSFNANAPKRADELNDFGGPGSGSQE